MSQAHRLRTCRVRVGHRIIGHGAPVLVQSMTTTPTANVRATLAQIRSLALAGCELIRVAVPDKPALAALPRIIQGSPLPVIADIHFDHTLALDAITAGVAKVRINPGNMGRDRSLVVARAAASAGKAVRIGVNAGSLPERDHKKAKTPEALGKLMARTALSYARAFEKTGLQEIVLSVKASNIRTTIAAYRGLSEKSLWPLHLGVTEAGDELSGAIKTAAGLSPLLLDGIGDTLRVSLTANPVREIKVADLLLSAAGVRRRGIEIISCPTCGRTTFDLARMVKQVKQVLAKEAKPLTVAIMGCVVNGPGEARHADVGLAGAPDLSFMLFAQGRLLRRVPITGAVAALKAEVEKMVK
ncbi:flavodoxin-dependent (E)-4-hydroxy-3-methylbut-2-enyl-diphosphate synthase [bacterium]|nr:flavodoxin-dependent (E)-4-hydroxy-3-methylbut-2-enyl-diphosphate synthase [bacterium]